MQFLWEDYVPRPEDILIDRVKRGEITPDEAEREAEMQGFGPLATKPDSGDFNPDTMPWWSLPMAVAWIAWRDPVRVRDQCAEFVRKCLIWVPSSYNAATGDGNELAHVDGYDLKEPRPPTVNHLALLELCGEESEWTHPFTGTSVVEAQKQLFAALAAGRITAIAKDASGNPIDIPQREWPYLKLFTDGQADVLKRNALDQPPAFSEVRLPTEILKRVWPELLVEPSMIEPMTGSATGGYVPLSSALHWIMTEGGKKSRRLEDAEAWAHAVKMLTALISTGEVQILGVPGTGGVPKPIEGHIFAMMPVPLNSLEGVFGDQPYIGWCQYIDKEHWNGDFNDRLYLNRSGPASWTHLQVKKADVLRHIAFDADTSEPTSHNGLALLDKSGGQSFASEDAILIEEMRALIEAKKAKNVSAAAEMVAPRAKRLGSLESVAERLRRAYGRKYPTRRRRRA